MYNKSRSISLIIDGSILLNRYIHLPVLLNSESKDVSIIYYFMKKVMSFIYEYMPDRVHLVFDIGRDIKKKTISNKYKSNRLNVGNKPYDHLLDDKKYQRLSFSRKVLIDIFNITDIVYGNFKKLLKNLEGLNNMLKEHLETSAKLDETKKAILQRSINKQNKKRKVL